MGLHLGQLDRTAFLPGLIIRMRKVIYTCLTGTYDSLLQPLSISEEFDYICFSDSLPAGQDGVWQIRPIPFPSKDKVLLSRFPKMQPHLVLPEYEYSVYMDANIEILSSSFYDSLNARIKAGDLISQVPHTYRKCVYQELYACWHHNMISLWSNVLLRHNLHRMGMPEDFGLMENNLILRNHNSPFVQEISNLWWKAFKSGLAKRDQLYLMPVYWQKHFMPSLIFGENRNVRNVDCLEWHPHKTARNDRQPKSAVEMYLMRLSNGAERRGWI